jgi:hypothetical protein
MLPSAWTGRSSGSICGQNPGLSEWSYVFVLFAIAHWELTGSSPAGMPAMEFLLFPVIASLLGASLLWIVVQVDCLWAGMSRRAPSFAAILLGTSIVVCGALLYSA